jgi:hypothetical protein
MNARWKMYEQNAPVYADGHYNVLEVYGLLLVYFELESQQKQDVIIDFCVDRCVIMNNGKRAFLWIIKKSKVGNMPNETVYKL